MALHVQRKRLPRVPLARWITDRYGLPCFLDNDVKAATFAERVFGVGRSCDNFAYVNIGTGIAPALSLGTVAAAGPTMLGRSGTWL